MKQWNGNYSVCLCVSVRACMPVCVCVCVKPLLCVHVIRWLLKTLSCTVQRNHSHDIVSVYTTRTVHSICVRCSVPESALHFHSHSCIWLACRAVQYIKYMAMTMFCSFLFLKFSW